MIKYFINFILTSILLISLNSCSTIYETIDLAGIVDETEELFFGKNKDEKSEISSDDIIEDDIVTKEEIPDISDIPTESPEFSDLEKDFFDGEKDSILEKEVLVKDEISKENNLKEKKVMSVEDKNIKVISQISKNIRMRVRQLIFNSDPPTKNDGKRLNYEKKDINQENFSEENKIAVFYFPNNSVIPDLKAQSVIDEIVKIYGDSLLTLVGHASSLGGNNPNGKKVNMKISFSRAESIKSMLANSGFPSDNITVLGKGDLDPDLASDGSSIESKNRRVEVFLMSE